jgi:UTP--glucose-1-phosphate uridylyltransferase
MQKVRKAVFPVAGLGTRFLPATKASPKEMLPIVDKPLIQYAVEEAMDAGITDIIFISSRTKRTFEDHFDKAYELETELAARGKNRDLELVQSIRPAGVNFIYIRQAEALGLGHAVLCAQPVIGNEPFAVILADDLIDGSPAVMKQMADQYEYYQCSVLGVQQVAPEETASMAERVSRVNAIVEKPRPDVAPSTLGVVGRYILTPRIFHHIQHLKPGAGGELQLTDAIAALLKEQQVLAYAFDGIRYDCGSKLGYLQATVEYALKHNEVNEDFAAYLKNRIC